MDMAERALSGGKLLASVENGVGLITFNQPEKRNAMSVEMWAGVAEVLADWSANPEIRVLVLTGAGDKAFVSGADISQFEKLRGSAEAQREYSRLTEPGRNSLAAFPKPVIARVRGFCLGGGLAIAMRADIRIAAADSTYGIPAARLGIAYTFDAVRALVALVGPAHARMLLYSGRRIGSAEAMRIGLVNQVVPDDELDETVRDLAATIAENAPLSIRASKLAVEAVLLDPDERDDAALAAAAEACFASEDYAEGRRAFLEKRRPTFRGK